MSNFVYKVKIGTNIATGVISAATIDLAKHNLKKLGYEILSITVSPDNKTTSSPDKHIFSFEALSQDGKKILGTITTTNEEHARKKLTEFYNLTVVSLIDTSNPTTLSPEKGDSIKEEAFQVIAKAELLLENLSIYDVDYNPIFDAKEDLKELVKIGSLQHVGDKITALLSLLQMKETSVVLDEKKKTEETVLQNTEDLISSIHIETKEKLQSPYGLYFNILVREVEFLSRALLLFYTIYFVIAETIFIKNFSFWGSDFIKNTLLSPLLFKISLTILCINIFCRIKLSIFENKISSGILAGILAFCMIVIIFLL